MSNAFCSTLWRIESVRCESSCSPAQCGEEAESCSHQRAIHLAWCVVCLFWLLTESHVGLCSIWLSSDLQLERSISQEIPETDKWEHQQGSRVGVKQLWLTPQCGSLCQVPAYMWLFEKVHAWYLSVWLILRAHVTVYCKNNSFMYHLSNTTPAGQIRLN